MPGMALSTLTGRETEAPEDDVSLSEDLEEESGLQATLVWLQNCAVSTTLHCCYSGTFIR